MTCIYPNSFTLGTQGTFALLTFEGWEDETILELESNTIGFTSISIQMQNSAAGKQVTHIFSDGAVWTTPEGKYKMKFVFPGLTEFKRQYQQKYEQQIGTIDRYMLQIIGYISSYNTQVSIQEIE